MSVHDYFAPEDLEAIEDKIEEVELKTSGEIRVVIADKCPIELLGDTDLHARIAFERLEMGETRDKTGVLILLEMKEKKFTVLADSGINEKLKSGYLQEVVKQASWHFGENRYVEGINEMLDRLGGKLADFFPPRADDVNELPNEVILETKE